MLAMERSATEARGNLGFRSRSKSQPVSPSSTLSLATSRCPRASAVAATASTPSVSRGAIDRPSRSGSSRRTFSVADLATTDRASLPLGVTSSFGLRMRLDSTLAPTMLDLRMNRQNMQKEFDLHGSLVSAQYALMKPRRRVSFPNPKDSFQVPPHLFTAAKRAEALRKLRGRESEQSAAKSGLLASLGLPRPRELPPIAPTPPNKDLAAVAQDAPKLGRRASGEAVSEARRDPRVIATFTSFGTVKEGSASTKNSRPPTMPAQRVSWALEGLGFKPEDLGSLDALLELVEDKDEVTLNEYARIYCELEVIRSEKLRETFNNLDCDNSGSISIREFRHLFWDHGYTVSTESVQELLREVDADGSGQVDFAEFKAAMRVFSQRHGFTQREADTYEEVFDTFDADLSGEISADEFVGILGWLGTPTSIRQAAEIIGRYDRDGSGTLCRAEFLMIMRARLEEEISDMRSRFAECDKDCSGTLDPGEIVDLLQEVGYCVSRDAVVQLIKELGMAAAFTTGMIFEGVLQLLSAIKKNEGFCAKEVEELKEVFRQNDLRGEGNIREFEMGNALAWLGYPVSIRRRRELWIKVDTDKSDSISEGEFLKLMRILREEEAAVAKQALGPGWVLGGTEMKAIVNRCGYAPPQETLDAAVAMSTDSSGDGASDVDGILKVLAFIRETQVQSLRQHAGLSDHMCSLLEKKCRSEDTSFEVEDLVKVILGIYKIVPSEEEGQSSKWQVATSKVASRRLSRSSGGNDAFKAIAKANKAKQETERVRNLAIEQAREDGRVDLLQAYKALKKYDDLVAEDRWRLERDAARKAGFSSAEVAQYRELFVAADDDGSGFLSEDEVLNLFGESTGSLFYNAQALRRHLGITVGKEGVDLIDFAEFLRLVKLAQDGVAQEASMFK